MISTIPAAVVQLEPTSFRTVQGRISTKAAEEVWCKIQIKDLITKEAVVDQLKEIACPQEREGIEVHSKILEEGCPWLRPPMRRLPKLWLILEINKTQGKMLLWIKNSKENKKKWMLEKKWRTRKYVEDIFLHLFDIHYKSSLSKI